MKSKKAMYSIIISGIQQIILLVLGLILPRLYIYKYGSEINGLISSIKQFLGYFTIAAAGIGSASVATLFEPILNNDTKKINKILSATTLFYRKASYIFISMVLILAMIYPFMIKNKISLVTTISLVLILGIGSVIEQFITAKYSVLLMADQKAYINAGIQTISNILNAIGVIVLIYFDFSIVYTQLIATTVIIIKLILMKKYIINNYPKINFNEETSMSYIPNRWDAFSYQMTGMIISYTPIALITIFCGLTDVSIYSIYNLIFSSVSMIIGIFSFGLSSTFGNLMAENNIEVLNDNYNIYEYLYYIVVFSLYTIAMVLINSFINIYTQGINDVNYVKPILGILFVLSGIIRNLRNPHVVLVEAGGLFKENNRSNILETIICLITSLIFVNYIGMNGVLLGLTIGYAYRLYKYIDFTSNSILGRNKFNTLKNIVINIILIIPSIMFTRVVEFINPQNLIIWGVVAVLCSIYVIVIFCIGNIILNKKLSTKLYNKTKSTIKSIKPYKVV